MKKSKMTPRNIAIMLIAFIAISMLLPACAHFHDEPTKSVWSGGLWLVFWIPFLGSLYFAYATYQAVKRFPALKFYETGWFIFFVILQIASWAICLGVNLSK
jgi:hypothetical protein